MKLITSKFNLILLFVLICSIWFISGCKNLDIDYRTVNIRNCKIINEEKKTIGKKYIFETDTSINFKTPYEIIMLFGKPDSDRNIEYSFPNIGMLWILDEALQKSKDCVVKMMEWDYIKLETRRIVFFIEKYEGFTSKWISITNLYYYRYIPY